MQEVSSFQTQANVKAVSRDFTGMGLLDHCVHHALIDPSQQVGRQPKMLNNVQLVSKSVFQSLKLFYFKIILASFYLMRK